MEEQWKRKIKMPIGVYVCAILVFLRFGVFQFINYYTAVREANGEAALPIVIVSLGLCVFTAAAAIWALIGDNEGRISLLIMVTLNLLWALFLATMVLSDTNAENKKDAVLYILNWIVTSLLMVAFYWYFFSREVVAYYKQND
jgi:hypothetical protein